MAGTDIIQTAAGDIRKTSDMRTEMVAKDFKRQSDISNEVAGEVSVFSEKENMTMEDCAFFEVSNDKTVVIKIENYIKKQKPRKLFRNALR